MDLDGQVINQLSVKAGGKNGKNSIELIFARGMHESEGRVDILYRLRPSLFAVINMDS